MPKIKNYDEIALNPSRKNLLEIIEAGLEAIDTRTVIQNQISIKNNQLCVGTEFCSLRNTDRIFLIAIGKCAYAAAEALEQILKERLSGGLIMGIGNYRNRLRRVRVFMGTHPQPTEQNIAATKELTELLSNLKKHDLVLAVISGGGSTLLCLPDTNTCAEEEMILKALTEKGATIAEINTVRKHTSLARGGYLAKYAYPAQVISLIFSDVPGNDLQYIASGPTVKDNTTVKDADKVLEKYGVLQECGIDHCGLSETPKDDKYFRKVSNIILVSNQTALAAMSRQAERLGYEATICDSCLRGEASVIGKSIANSIGRAKPKTALLYGGETTVTLRRFNDFEPAQQTFGTGGRNQELALSAIRFIKNNELVLSLASDGRDNGPVAGAIADSTSRDQAKRLGLNAADYLSRHNSYDFFRRLKGQIITGDTGSNVSDLVVAIKD